MKWLTWWMNLTGKEGDMDWTEDKLEPIYRRLIKPISKCYDDNRLVLSGNACPSGSILCISSGPKNSRKEFVLVVQSLAAVHRVARGYMHYKAKAFRTDAKVRIIATPEVGF